MEKAEAVGKLKKAGYQVQFDSSIVSILLPAKANVNQEIKKLRLFFQEIGYDASFGIRQLRDTSDKDSNQDEAQTEASMPAIHAEASEEQSKAEQKEEIAAGEVIVEVGEQFSLEDFGLS